MKKRILNGKRIMAALCAAVMAAASVSTLVAAAARTTESVSDNYEEKICAGLQSAAFVDKEGNLWSWGRNNKGQLGHGNKTTTYKPTKVSSLENMNSVSIYGNHMAAVTKDGKVYDWGYNYAGQLGNGTRADQTSPVQVTAEGLDQVKKVSCGGLYTLALENDGDLWIWGKVEPTSKYTTTPICFREGIWQVKTGYDVSGIVDSEGKLYLWGANSYGKIGNGSEEGVNYDAPYMIDLEVSHFDLGPSSSCAVTKDGDLYTWGINSEGQLGYETTTESEDGHLCGLVPAKVPNMTEVSKAYMGASNGAAIKKDGSLWLWGKNENGIIDGNEDTEKIYEPTKVMEDVAAVDFGIGYIMVVTKNGNIYTWGDNSNGKLGINSETITSTDIPQLIKRNAIEISKNDSNQTTTATTTATEETTTATNNDAAETTTATNNGASETTTATNSGASEATTATTDSTTETAGTTTTVDETTTIERDAIISLVRGKTKSVKIKVAGNANVNYKSGNSKIASVNKYGTVKAKGYGTTTIKITVSEKKNKAVKNTVLKIKIKVIPKRAVVTQVSSSKKRTLKISWRKDKTTNLCQIQVSKNKNFKGDVITRTRKNDAGTITLKSLKRKTTYYVRVRNCWKTKKASYYGAYSEVKKIKIK